MKRIIGIFILACMLLPLGQLQGKGPRQEKVTHEFEVTFSQTSGDILGYAISEPTVLKSNVGIIGFGGQDYVYEFHITDYFGSCFSDYQLDGVMGVHSNFQEGGLVARFWFDAPNRDGELIKYALALYDTDELVWSGDFPPADGDTITRTAGRWAINPARNRDKNLACTGGADFEDGDEVTVTLSHEDQH